MSKKINKKMTKKTVKKVSTAKIKSTKIQIGEVAPNFTLLDQNGQEISLKDFKGMNVVVYFYPKAMTPGCTVQACGVRDSQKVFKTKKIVVLGISADPVHKLKQFEEKQHLNFPLLSDLDHKVCEAYGSWGLKKFMGREFMGIHRQSFLINMEGKVVHIFHKVDTKTHHEDILNIFKDL